MDTERKIARLIMTSYSDRAGDDRREQRKRVLRDVKEFGACGYCVFGGSVEHTRALNEEASAEAGRTLLVASDLERGLGQQLLGGTVFPSQMAIGATGSPALAHAVGLATAVEARSAGINLVFSPVADTMTEPANPIIGTRSYGDDVQDVVNFTQAFVAGCQLGGAAATVKHFPGHGDTTVDSHVSLPTVSADAPTLEARELAPFRAAVAADVKAIMTAHVAFPALTGDNTPATLSPDIVGGILRSRIGFGGVVVTDALLMGAIAELHGPGEAAVRALEAGADVLLMPEDAAAAAAGVSDALASGRLSEERIDRSVGRIAELVAWIESSTAGAGLPDGLSPNAVARDVAARAVTLLKDDGLLPLDVPEGVSGGVTALACADEDHRTDLSTLRELLGEAVPGIELRELGAGSSRPPGAAADEGSRDGLAILFVFDEPAAWRGRPGPSSELVRAAARVVESHARSIVIGFAAPRLASLLPDAGAFLCCYDTSAPMQRAAVDALVGRAPVRGRLPAAVPGLYPRGHGLTSG